MEPTTKAAIFADRGSIVFDDRALTASAAVKGFFVPGAADFTTRLVRFDFPEKIFLSS
ncbi:hypothetical protein [Cribrihabitans pelagius]|uniref:hypothetical protein n=1 Tax=Cribrihabitans pelagius TaxID=1765746 RepID=UPI003B5B96C2